jgi:hypothetical protein
MVQRSSAAARLTDIVSIRPHSVLLNADCLAYAFALAIDDSIPLQEVERQLLGNVCSSVQTRNVAGNRDWSVEDDQLFFRLRFSRRQVDIDPKLRRKNV